MKLIVCSCVLIATLFNTVVNAQQFPTTAVFKGFKQGRRGNCASVAAIKAAINTFGPDSVFISTTKTATGYDVVLRNRGERISVTNDEIYEAIVKSDIEPNRSNRYYKKAYKTAMISYAVIAKRRSIEKGEDYSKALEELGKGQIVCNVFRWMGLQQYTSVRPWMSNVAGIQSVVVGGRHHAAFCSYNEVDLWGKTKRLYFHRLFWRRIVIAHDPKGPHLNMIAFNRDWNKTIGECCISGIEWKDGMLFAVSDEKPDRIIRAKFSLIDNQNGRYNITLEKAPPITMSGYDSLDGLESIRLRGDSVYISDERHSEETKTGVRTTKLVGNDLVTAKVKNLPTSMNRAKLQHNTGLEGMSFFEKDPIGYWIAAERPLMGGYDSIDHPVTYVRGSKEKSYRYRLDNFPDENDRGISEILVYNDHRILFLERHYDNVQDRVFARIYIGTMLENREILKTLLIDLNRLPIPKVDNYEGMCWGPRLSNGHRTLILISDDNDNRKYGQNTDIILLEVVD